MFIMWLGEQITEHGVGNGISLIIMAGIIAQLYPAFVKRFFGRVAWTRMQYQTLLLFLGAWIIAVFAVVFMTKAQRRIPDPAGQANPWPQGLWGPAPLPAAQGATAPA